MSEFKNWREVKKEIEKDFTEEEIKEMEQEKERIRRTIERRENCKLKKINNRNRINKKAELV